MNVILHLDYIKLYQIINSISSYSLSRLIRQSPGNLYLGRITCRSHVATRGAEESLQFSKRYGTSKNSKT